MFLSPVSATDPGRRVSTEPDGGAIVERDVSVDLPGLYPTGQVGLARNWDGHAWAVEPVADPQVAALALPRHPLRTTRRFWTAVVALVVGVVVASIGSAQPEPVRTALLVAAAVVSTGGALLALTASVWRRLRVLDVVDGNGWSRWRLAGLGTVSGVVAVGVALGVELCLGRVFGRDSVTILFLAGPIEETAKLALPVVLLVTLKDRLCDPRLGFALVWVSGAVFGLLEGVEYVAGLGPKSSHQPTGEMATVVQAAAMTAIRTLVELMHPMLTSAAAAALWLGLWRRSRLLTRTGVLAFLVSVVLHSANDGVLGGWAAHVSPGLSLAGSPVMLLLIYAVLRSRSRELAPPSRLVDLPRRWRPVLHPSAPARVPGPSA